jgi:wyosine [tRNA(Phe)-imidazoG37] synthetase (radical SAM superfamily)
MKSYCNLPFIRLKIDDDGSYQSCCHQTIHYGNFIKDNTTIEEAVQSALLREVRVATLNNNLHSGCSNTQCPMYYKDLTQKPHEVSITPYPKQIELSLPATWCNIGGLTPTPATACIMCPRSSKQYMSRYINGDVVDNTNRLCEIIKPAIPHLETLTILGIAEPFYKGRLFDVFDKLEFKKHKDNIMFWTFCNGSLFGEQNQEKYINEYVHYSSIGFSIDAATPETYQKIRRLDYYKTIARNLENYFNKTSRFTEKRDWSFTAYNINKLNLHEMEDMVRFSHNIGADKTEFTLTYTSDTGMALDKSLLCNESNWQEFWEMQQRVEQLAKELDYRVDFYVPFHKGFLK